MISIPHIDMVCGPTSDIRNFNLTLPLMKRKIGVLVSGGLDSALLYYALKKIENENYSIKPFTFKRDDGSEKHAQIVIDEIHKQLGKDKVNTTWIQLSKKVDSHYEVGVGTSDLLMSNIVNCLYMGIIDTLPEHSVGYPIFKVEDNTLIRYPLKNLTKIHVVDLIIKFKQEYLFTITHSCVYNQTPCGHCNRCNEKKWALDFFGIKDCPN